MGQKAGGEGRGRGRGGERFVSAISARSWNCGTRGKKDEFFLEGGANSFGMEFHFSRIRSRD